MPPPSPLPLQQLDRLDASSPEFGDQLKNVLYGQEYMECVPNLEGDDLEWIVEYLSKVRRHTPLPTLHPFEQAQVLRDLDPSGLASRKCLRELRSICGARMILPASYTLSSHLLHISDDPFVSGGFSDVYEGSLNGSKVCIKRIRVYTKYDPKTFTKVSYVHCRLTLLHHQRNPGTLPGSCDVETLDTPKYPASPGRYSWPAPAHFALDA